MEMIMGIVNWLIGAVTFLLTGMSIVGIIILILISIPLLALIFKIIEHFGLIFIKSVIYLLSVALFICVVGWFVLVLGNTFLGWF